ncbi:hypothetical protein DFH09DRAFT_1096449 [Mycena vulgaris]|nr:hypothetical protein DFH09DRAFT_1096449 [Mycena vulgaris]
MLQLDLGPVDTGASTSGPHYNIESLGPKEGPFWEPELVTTHVATVQDAVGAGDQIFQDVDRFNTLNTFIPAENCSVVNQTELHTIFGYSILNVDSIPSALSDHSPESEDMAFDTTLPDLTLNQSGLRASQELPPLPAPHLAPSTSPAELEEPVNNPVDGNACIPSLPVLLTRRFKTSKEGTTCQIKFNLEFLCGTTRGAETGVMGVLKWTGDSEMMFWTALDTSEGPEGPVKLAENDDVLGSDDRGFEFLGRTIVAEGVIVELGGNVVILRCRRHTMSRMSSVAQNGVRLNIPVDDVQ